MIASGSVHLERK